MEKQQLRDAACQFAQFTDAMLVAAERGLWDEFFQVLSARAAQMALLEAEAGDQLLIELPDLKTMMVEALEKNRKLELLATAKRDELAAELATFHQQRRLSHTYR